MKDKKSHQRPDQNSDLFEAKRFDKKHKKIKKEKSSHKISLDWQKMLSEEEEDNRD